LRIGRVEGEAPYLLDDIRGVTELYDGTILIVDNGSKELRVFGADGVFRRSEGGPGRGPGEFVSVRLVRTPHTDSILVFDRTLKRFTIFGPTLQAPTVMRVEQATRVMVAMGASPETVLSGSIPVLR
jgi:hypothetical protein